MKRFVYSVLVILFGVIFGLVGCDADAADSEESSVQPAAVPNAGSYYTIRFDNANGTGETTDDQVKVKTRYEIPECMFTPKNDAKFVKWSDQRDGFGNSYDAGDKIKDPVGKGEVYTLYAIWDKTYYNVKYNANGGSGTMADSEFQVGRLATLPNCGFTKTDMRLRCWTTKEDGTGSSYRDRSEFIPSVRANDVVNLYAQWIDEDLYLINYHNVMNADNSANPDVFSKTTAFSLHDITRKGYTFLGWYDAETDGSKVTGWAANSKTDDLDLWAYWSVKTYSVTLNMQSGSGGTASVTAAFDERLPDVTVPTRDGFEFGGYWTEPNGAGVQYIDEDGKGTKIWDIDSTSTLHAKWTGVPYTIEFDANGGSGVMASIELRYGDGGRTLPANEFTMTSKIFAGWSTSADAAVVEYQDEQLVSDLSAIGETIKLYAVWDDPYPVTYTFKANGGNWNGSTADKTIPGVVAEEFSGVPDDPIRTGYTFSGWDSPVPSKFGSADKTFTAQWTAHTYTIVYNSNGGSGSMNNQTMTYDTPAYLSTLTFTRDGYCFTGWNTQANGNGTSYTYEQQLSNLTSDNGAEIKLYAQWRSRAAGDIWYSDSTAASIYIKGKTPIGIIYDIGTNISVLHLNQASKKRWCTTDAVGYTKLCGTSQNSGRNNWSAVCSKVTDENVTGRYPAFEYCNGLHDGGKVWYLPALEELKKIYNKMTAINNALGVLRNSSVSVTDLNKETNTDYWSSSDGDDANRARVVDFKDGYSAYMIEKYAQYTVRAVTVY